MAEPTLVLDYPIDGLSGLIDYFTLDSSSLDGPLGLAPDDETLDLVALEDVRGIDVSRGRNRDLDQVTAGTMTVTLDDRARRYDPSNNASPFAGQIAPLRPMRLAARVGDTEIDLFTGRADSWKTTYQRDVDAETTVALTDALERLAAADLDELDLPDYFGDTTGERIERVLALPEVAYTGPTDIDEGQAELSDTTFGGNALQYLHRVVGSEPGTLFVARDGTLVFKGRDASLTGAGLSGLFQYMALDSSEFGTMDTGPGMAPRPILRLSDVHPEGIRYREVEPEFDAELVYNRIKVTTEEPLIDDVVVADDDSIVEVGARTLTVDTFLNHEDDMESLGEWLLARFRAPELRLRRFSIRPLMLTAPQQVAVLGLEPGDRIVVERTPPGGGSPATIRHQAVVDRISISKPRNGPLDIDLLVSAAGAPFSA